MRVLDGVNARSLAGFGWESFAWVRCTGFADGGLPMGSILGSAHGDGKLDGETFLGRTWMFFSWGGGGGEEEAPGQVLLSRFRRTTRAFKQSHFYVIYSILISGGFAAACFRPSRKVDPRCPGQRTCAVQASTARRPLHASKTVKGLLLLVPPRTPRSSGYGFLCTCGLCYMLFPLYF